MSPKVVAVAYALLMFTSALPAAEASHTDPLTPEVPVLPHAEPSQDCIGTTIQSEEILARANALAAGDPAWYRDPVGVPAFCPQGGPSPEYVQLVRQLDRILENLRNASREVQRQVDIRLEATLPASEYPNDLVEPRAVLLDERFDGKRYTGFGDWKVITEKGEPAAFRLQTVSTVNGTQTVYRFGNDQGYERGIHQWLVSPEIDLSALKGNETAVRDLTHLRETARNQLWRTCNTFGIPTSRPAGEGIFSPFCGQGTSFEVLGPGTGLDAVVAAYEMAIDSTVYELPVMQHGAFMDLTYRFNLAPGEDGVRVWIYSGDRAPDRRTLFHPGFGDRDAYQTCAYHSPVADPTGSAIDGVNDSLENNGDVTPLTCQQNLAGGQPIPSGNGDLSEPLPGMELANAFRQDAPLPNDRYAFTGNMSEFTTARVNLTDFMGDRIWLLLEVKTSRNDRGIDIFSDTGRFGRQRDFGFELARVYAEGDGYHRNVRLKDVAATYDPVAPDNELRDASNVRVAIPPGDEPVVVYVQNAGDYRENATLTVTSSPGRTYTTRIEMIPDEVKTVRIPWGELTPDGGPIRNNTLYDLTASIALITNRTPTLSNISRTNGTAALDPNVTEVRPVNAAGRIPDAGVLTLTQPVRAAVSRELTLLRADGAQGVAIQLCSAVNGVRCDEHYAGRKGEERTILVGIRNDGNAPQDASIELKLELDGVAHPEMVVGSTRLAVPDLLPGETRPISWTLVPTLPGAYRVVVVPQREGDMNAKDNIAERLMFVQRSTGLLCLDTLETRECGATYEGGYIRELNEEDITAVAVSTEGTLYVATRTTEADPVTGVEHGILASREPSTGVWRVLANISAPNLNATFNRGPMTNFSDLENLSLSPTPAMAWGPIRAMVPTPEGFVYLFGDNSTTLRLNLTNTSDPKLETVVLNAHHVNFTDALYWNGTVHAVGDNGTLLYLTQKPELPPTLERMRIWNSTGDQYRFWSGTFTALATGPKGQLVALGQDGYLFHHTNLTNVTVNSSWVQLKIVSPRPGGDERALRAATVYGGRLYVAGDDGALLASTDGNLASFVNLTPPVPTVRSEEQRDFEHLFVADGRLQVLDGDDMLASCRTCLDLLPDWAYEALPLPTLYRIGQQTRLASVTHVAQDAKHAMLLGEGGLVLDRIERGEYENDLTWSTVPSLAPRDGGVLQTKRRPFTTLDTAEFPQAYLGIPAANGLANATDASQFRLFINHTVVNASKTSPVSVRLLYRPLYEVRLDSTTPVNTCDIPTQDAPEGTPRVTTGIACDAVRRVVASFDRPSDTDGWTRGSYGAISNDAVGDVGGAGAQNFSLAFHALELYQSNGSRWAIDDVRLQGLVDGVWQDVISWHGPNKKTGNWLVSSADLIIMAQGGPETGSVLNDEERWEAWPEPLELATVSPWHYTSDFADKPVWAANNEFRPGDAAPEEPRLRSTGSSRLLTPIVDLSNAYDPQLVFRHNYSFRTLAQSVNDIDSFTPGDGGTVEVQYLRQGLECGSTDVTVTCGWSRFYTLQPDGGYPTAEGMGFADARYEPLLSGPRAESGRVAPGRAFWGRLATPDESGSIGGTRDTTRYQEVRVTLDDAACDDLEIAEINRDGKTLDCVYFERDGLASKVNLTGHKVRFAFHLWQVTFPHDTGQQARIEGVFEQPGSTTYGGEGWFVTDVSVRGAAQLGIDLAAQDLRIAVGYDVDEIGVGPGTRVPVNVTVVNLGAFDALGYTGELRVHQVLDRVTGRTTLVDTISLAQQPVLDVGKRVNHTLFWSVPGEESAEYVLSFEVKPIGITRDESFLDNRITLNSTGAPLIARSVARFETEFLVSPENATADITRYIPMFINNTGNVPLEAFQVERRITKTGVAVTNEARTCSEWRTFQQMRLPTAIVECRQWTTTRAAPPGVRTPLTLLSEQVNPSTDLFWKAPERADFVISLSASTTVGERILSDSAVKLVRAYATFLFDDIESGTRGDAYTGSWVYGPGWNVSQPGFRSSDAYGFGNTSLGRYAPDTNASLLSPTIEIGNARTAQVAFYHKYDLEPSYDGGLIEASADNGATWTAIRPLFDPGSSVSYASTLVQPASPIHPNGDPDVPAFAFTGSSSDIEGNSDGWVLTQVDLTDFASVTEPSVAYQSYSSLELGDLDRVAPETPVPDQPDRRLFRAENWCTDPENYLCWTAENLSVGLRSPLSETDPDNWFFWSGSPRTVDDGVRPLVNSRIEFTLDMRNFTEGQRIVAEWWEYATRVGAHSQFIEGDLDASTPYPNADLIVNAQTFMGTSAGITWRYNLGEARILETRGHWYRMQSDITDMVREQQAKGQMAVGFGYTPVRQYADKLWPATGTSAVTIHELTNATSTATGSRSTDYFGLNNDAYFPRDGRYENDSGFAVDGFKVSAIRESRGASEVLAVLLDESSPYQVYECGGSTTSDSKWSKGDSLGVACLKDSGTTHKFARVPADATTLARTYTTACNMLATGGTPNQACLDTIARMSAITAPGRMWNKTTELPAVPAPWQVVNVRDHFGATELPTGEASLAWWTGDVYCRSGFQSEVLRCPTPGSEGRLVTPAIDLALVAGDEAYFTFWHRFGFYPMTATYGGMPLTSGGVVEMQEYDPQTDTWSPWKQVYAHKNFNVENATTSFLEMGRSPTMRGGYTAVTADVSRGTLGPGRFDSPFEPLDLKFGDDKYQFLYSGNSHWIEGNSTPDGAVDGWLKESYDVSGSIGKRVRFGFHYSISDWPSYAQADDNGAISDPDGNLQDDPNPLDTDANNTREAIRNDRGGWWITDMQVVGDVLVGKPIQLRLRAGSDGNIQDGGWIVDDFGVFGSRYKENVGIFVDTTPGKFGAYAGNETVIPITLRNLGESVRRDLAIEVTNTGDTQLTMSGRGPTGNETAQGRFVLTGFTLAPGQSTTAELRVRAPRSLGEEDSVKLLLRLKELNPITQPGDAGRFASIMDNEVQGILQREIGFGLQRLPEAQVASSTIRQTTPAVGDLVQMDLAIENPGYGPTTLSIECVAHTVSEHADMLHATPTSPDTPVVKATYPCAFTGNLTLPAKSTERYVFNATPTEAGFLSFQVKASIRGAGNFTRSAGIAVGSSPFVYTEDFDQPADLTEDFVSTSTTGARWSYLRGHDGSGALLIGIDENDTDTSGYAAPPEQGGCPDPCRARTKPIDLHNFSLGSPAFLSFWHIERFAKFDGAQVRAQILLNEQNPGSSNANTWSEPCILKPIGDYEGRVFQTPTRMVTTQGATGGPTAIPGDTNAAFRDGTIYDDGDHFTTRDFFVSEGGQWEETWELATFDLSAPCKAVRKGGPELVLAGKTVRFDFELFVGGPFGELRRGMGHGWLIDDIVVGPYALDVRPAGGQKAVMLDNTTKSFNVVVTNRGATPDVVQLVYDAQNSSTPADGVRVPEGAVTLAPGESRILTVQATLPRDPSLLPTEFKARFIARSVIDRNAVGTTTIDLVFAPRPWAELGLTVAAPSSVVQEGTETFIPLTIENSGVVDSIPSRVLIVDEWDGGRRETSLVLGSIPTFQSDPDGAIRVLEFQWRPDEGSVGDHRLTFIVDPDVLGEEYSRSNNVVALTIPVSDLLIPDLKLNDFQAVTLRNNAGGVVTPDVDADVARYEVTAGEVVTFEVKVQNPGRAGATNVDLRAFIGSLSLPPKRIPYIAPGSEVVVSFAWLAQKGEHNLEFLARGEQVELSVENNRYPGLGRTILTVKGYEVEVAIADLPALLEPGTETTFPFSISNAGNAGEDLVLRATSPAGTHVQLPREGFFLRPGETYVGDARLLLDAEAVAGEQFISIDAVARENPMKVASGRAAMRVNASYGGSVVGGVGVGAPTEIEVPLDLINEGNSLEPWTLRVDLPAGWTSKEKLPLKVVVPAHDSTRVTLHVQVPATTAPGDRTMRLVATMPNGETREGTARVQVSAMRVAGLVFADEKAEPDRGSLRIPVEVENKGNVKQPFSVVLTHVPAGLDLRITPDTFELEPGQKAVAALVVKPNASVPAGTYAITSYTRFEGVVASTREGLANVQTLAVPLVRQDLAIGAIEVTPRTGIEPGDRVVVKVPIENRGVRGLANVPVHLFVDDVFVAETLLASLDAGQRGQASFNWTAIEGIHTLTAVVDPYEDTVEADRADNAVSQLVTVGDASAEAGGVAAGRADTPGLGVVGLLAAFAIGLLLTRGTGSRRQRR